MKYFIVCGEPSGDKLGGPLVSALYNVDANAEIAAWGGSNIKDAGAKICQDINAFGMMGFQEVAKNIFTLIQLFNQCKENIKQFVPDVVILIDFGGFNRRLLPTIKKLNTKIVYYSPPKLWASRSYRVGSIRKYVDLAIVLFPFEYDFYEKARIKVAYFGNPMVDTLNSQIDNSSKQNTTRLIGAIIPGSRRQEIRQILPIMIAAAIRYSNFEWHISCMSKIGRDFYQNLIPKNCKNIYQTWDQHHHLLSKANIAMVTSGTATLEATLLNVPQIVCYKTGTINYWIAKAIIKVPFISLPNLIANKRVVPELIQKDLTVEKLLSEIKNLQESETRDHIRSEYGKIRSDLTSENTIQKSAQAIFQLVG